MSIFQNWEVHAKQKRVIIFIVIIKSSLVKATVTFHPNTGATELHLVQDKHDKGLDRD